MHSRMRRSVAVGAVALVGLAGSLARVPAARVAALAGTGGTTGQRHRAVRPESSAPFDVSFSEMSKLTGLTAAGKGLVGVILPDETSSTRYVDFDAPYLTKAFQLRRLQLVAVQDRQRPGRGPDRARRMLRRTSSLGATVLIFDPLDSTVGSQIQQFAAHTA